MLVPVVRRARVPSRSSLVSLLFSTNLSRLFSMEILALSSAGAARSTSCTSNPFCAKIWAMPLPIVPAPITPTRLMFSMHRREYQKGEGARRVQERVRHESAFHRQRDAVAAAETQRRDAPLEPATLERIKQRRQHARTTRSNCVSERHRAAVDVHARRIDPELAQDSDQLH